MASTLIQRGLTVLFPLSLISAAIAQTCDFEAYPATEDKFYLALGDSYSAGPGAGERYDQVKYDGDDCMRTQGSYPYKLAENNDLSIQVQDEFQFLSCTGHITDQIIQYQLPDVEWPAVEYDMKITLSIGGNDIGFVPILKPCLLGFTLGPGERDEQCKAAMANAMNLLNNEDGQNTFKNKLYSVWSAIFQQASSATGQKFYPFLKHTAYPLFFNAETDHCDDTKIIPVIPWAPKLDKDLRRSMNNLASLLNQRIQEHIISFQTEPENYYALGRMNFVDQNPLWEGHRLCEEFITSGQGFTDPNVWFFGLGGPDSTRKRENLAIDGGVPMELDFSLDDIDPVDCNEMSNNIALAIGCALKKMDELTVYNWLVGKLLNFDLQFVAKFFHPKSAGHGATKEEVLFDYGGRDAEGRMIRRDNNHAGLHARTQDPPGTPSLDFRVAHVGTIGCLDRFTNLASQLGEATLVDIQDSPNVVLFYDGKPESFQPNRTIIGDPIPEWTAQLDKIVRTAPDATVLASRLVPPADADAILKLRYGLFNDAVTRNVQQRVASGAHIVLMAMDELVAAGGDERNKIEYWVNGVEYASVFRHWI